MTRITVPAPAELAPVTVEVAIKKAARNLKVGDVVSDLWTTPQALVKVDVKTKWVYVTGENGKRIMIMILGDSMVSVLRSEETPESRKARHRSIQSGRIYEFVQNWEPRLPEVLADLAGRTDVSYSDIEKIASARAHDRVTGVFVEMVARAVNNGSDPLEAWEQQKENTRDLIVSRLAGNVSVSTSPASSLLDSHETAVMAELASNDRFYRLGFLTAR